MNLDLWIFSIFLAISLVLGILSSKKVTNISEYAIGGRNFSTPTMIATIIATWVGGAFFSYGLIETYRQGIYFAIPALMDSIGMMLIGWVFAPRMGEFLGRFSVAEAMGQMFGSKVRIITVIFALIRCIGSLGVQFKVSSKVLEIIFGTSGEYATILSAFIVILYSTLGGIRAVTFTDVIQFFTFGCLIPIVGIILWEALGQNSGAIVWETLSTNALFDYSKVFSFSNPKFFQMLGMSMIFLFPQFAPTTFQRISMGRGVNQVTSSFKISGMICFLLQCIVIGIGILILSVNPNINPDNLIQYIINNYTYTGLKGMLAVGIMAMIMSSADSLIHSLSVIFAHDLCRPLGFKWAQNELLVARVASVVAGLVGIFLALHFDRVLSFVLSFTTLYLPIISLPFVLAVLGFRSSGNSVLAGMTGSLVVIVICRTFLEKTAAQTFIPSLISNLICLFSYHYLTNQKGGWIGIKDPAPLIAIRQERRFKLEQFMHSITNFDFAKFLEKNTPNSESIYVYTGFFCFLSFYLNLITVNYDHAFSKFFQFATPVVLCMATSLFIYPLWPDYLKGQETIVRIIWNIAVFYSLIFVGFMFAIASNFASFQVMALMVNLIVIAILVKWQWALAMIISGIFVVWRFTNSHFAELIAFNQGSIKLQIAYLLLLMGSLFLIFLKPKQEGQTLAMARIKHLKGKILSYEACMIQAMSSNSKVHNVDKYYEKDSDNMSIAHMFFDFYDNLSHEEQKETARLILRSVMRLENFESNLANLSALARDDVSLNREQIDFTYLIKDRLRICRKLYEEEGNEKQFILNISENVRILGDRFYFEQIVDNLIINAIMYCTSQTIAIHLEKFGPNSLRLYIRI